MSKATFVFPVKTATAPATVLAVSITSYTSGYQYQLGSAAVRQERHSYPIRIKEQDLNITVQCRSVAEYDLFKKTVGITQRLMLADVTRGFVRFSYPELGIDYLGFIPQIQEGVRRFVSAPVISFLFSPVQDTINTIASIYSNANGTWKDIAGSDLVQLPAPGVADQILHNNPPTPDVQTPVNPNPVPPRVGTGPRVPV